MNLYENQNNEQKNHDENLSLNKDFFKDIFNNIKNYCKENRRNILLSSVAIVAIISIFSFIADTAWSQIELQAQVEKLSDETSDKENELNELMQKSEILEKELEILAQQKSQIETSENETQDQLNKILDKEEQLYKELENLEKYINDNYEPKISGTSVSRGGAKAYSNSDPLIDRVEDFYKKVVSYKGTNEYTENLRIAIEAAKIEYKLYINQLPDAKPLKSIRVTSNFGYRKDPFTGRTSYHNGIDLGAPVGTSVYACGAGVVTFAAYNGGYGNLVVIDHGNGIETLYAHNSKLYVKKGDFVGKGDKIAAVGSTGRSTGPHLHLSVRKNGKFVDPRTYVRF